MGPCAKKGSRKGSVSAVNTQPSPLNFQPGPSTGNDSLTQGGRNKFMPYEDQIIREHVAEYG
jgi:hypothetical protein